MNRKSFVIPFPILLSGGFLLLFLPLFSFGQSFEKIVKKEFTLESGGALKLDNQYGEVIVKTWEKNLAEVEVTITVEASSESAAQNTFDRIQITSGQNGNSAQVMTVIEAPKKKFWNWEKKNDFRIDYQVSMPRTSRLDLRNQFGDVFVEELLGDVSLELSHGNLRMEGAKGKLDLTLDYGDGTVVEAASLNARVYYGKLQITEAGSGQIDSKYSRIRFDFAGELHATSKYDTYEIGELKAFRNEGKYDNIRLGEVERVQLTSQYSDVRIESLEEVAECELRYGALAIHHLAETFSRVELRGRYTDFKLRASHLPAYRLFLSGEHLNYKLPDAFQLTHKQSEEAKQELGGYAGRPDAPGLIKAQIAYGGLVVK